MMLVAMGSNRFVAVAGMWLVGVSRSHDDPFRVAVSA
jgi:hypothetical protein